MIRTGGLPLFLCFILIFQAGSAVAQSCESAFFKRYNGVANSNDSRHLCISKNDNIIAAISEKKDCAFLKLDSMGNVVKGKKISSDDGSHGAYDLLKMKDQNFLLADFMFNGNIDSSKINLLKFDENLDTIWSRKYKLPFKYSSIYRLTEGEDGSIYMYFQFSYTSYGAYPDYWAVAKLNANGSLLWCRTYKPPEFQVIYLGRIVEWGDYLYFSCENSMDNYSSFVFKIEKSTGNLVWAKSYRITGKETNLGKSLTVLGNTLILSGDDRINGSQVRALLLALDADGNTVQAKSYSWTDGTVSMSTTRASGNRLYVAGSVSSNNNAVNQNLYAQFDENLNMLLASSTGLPYFTRDIDISESGQAVETGFISYNQSDVDFFIRKRLSSGQAGSCSEQNILLDELKESVIVKNIPVTTGSIILPVATPRFSITGETLSVKDSSCIIIKTCTSVKVSGITDACGSGNTYTYKVATNSGCTGMAGWQYDTAFVEKIVQTDSSIEVRFKKSGLAVIKSQLATSCSILLEDSISIRINNVLRSIDLGADKPLCKDSVLVLSPGNTFASYQWQDGSTSPSLKVTTPGIYHVAATDLCGGIARDTIFIGNDLQADFNLVSDTGKCQPDSIKLVASTGFRNYSWSPSTYMSGGSGPTVLVYPVTDTKYYIKAEKTNGCMATDSVQIHIKYAPALNLGKDTSFCATDSIRLFAGNGFEAYQWNTGSTLPEITVSKAGMYTIMATASNGCIAKDTLSVLQVYAAPVPALGKDFNLCMNDQRRLDAGNFSSYNWQNGSTNRYLTVQATGTYWVKVTDQHQCTANDTIEVARLLPAPANFLPPADSICGYGEVELRPAGDYLHYNWSTGAISKNLVVNKPGLYILAVTDQNGCAGNDTIQIVQKSCASGVYLPGAFTPDKNGRNDIFRAIVWGNVTNFRLRIYNRFGQMVFSTSDPAKGWDGTMNGRPCDTGAFVYTCSYQLQSAGILLKKGTMLLVR